MGGSRIHDGPTSRKTVSAKRDSRPTKCQIGLVESRQDRPAAASPLPVSIARPRGACNETSPQTRATWTVVAAWRPPLGAASGPAQTASASAAKVASGRFVRSADGLTVHDALLHVTWLADGNLPASQKFGLPISEAGAMTYQVARRWVAALNASNGGAGYLGHKNWTLPATPATDETCSVARGHTAIRSGSIARTVRWDRSTIAASGFANPIPRCRSRRHRRAVQEFPAVSVLVGSTARNRTGGQYGARTATHAFSFNTGWQGGNVSHPRHVRAADDRWPPARIDARPGARGLIT